MFSHSVYFWLREDLSSSQVTAFLDGIESLRRIDSVQKGFIGTPAATDRAVIERSYSHALVLLFPDAEAHDAYQVHPVHDAFRQRCAGFWSKIVIYDAVGDAVAR
jgi:hypothetical protein